MAPIPLEGLQAPIGNSLAQGNPNTAMNQEGNRGGSISLAMLIDFIVQRTYNELTVLAELLPRKTDMERKIEIYNYSARTRQLFVRLLALVKWASSASKVEKSARAMAFLDKQSILFVDTADRLARIARETLVHARLPNFHIPAAVEVLTTGTYSRLPSCIREKIVPPDPITPQEKRETLQRLNQVIQHRLVNSISTTSNVCTLPPQMRNLKIDTGRVTFHVANEFEVSLTLMGDGPNIPWRLLDVKILVDDKDTGDGKALVHPLQTQYIHQVLQARLAAATDETSNPPLVEVYNFLHFFCQALQLEVLYTQTLRLMRDRLDDHIHVDEYCPGRGLTISYWRELTSKDPKSELGYKLVVQVDSHDPARPLSVVHVPTLSNKECDLAADHAIRSDTLSMERLLIHTIYVRTKNRLNELKTELQQMLKDVECNLQGSPAILSVAILQPCLRAEQLLVTVDTHTGMLQCHVPQYEIPSIMPDLNQALNGDHSKISNLISELRYWITQRRCEKTIQHLPASCFERLPLLFHPDHPITKITKHRMFVQLHRHPNVILIVQLKEKDQSPCEIEFSFYLAIVRYSSIDENPQDDNIESDIPKMYLRVLSLLQFDTFVITHGPFTNVSSDYDIIDNSLKRKITQGGQTKDSSGNASGSPVRKSRQPAYFIPELAHVVALCDERLPFVLLGQELNKREIFHQGVQIESNASAIIIRLVSLPPPTQEIAKTEAWLALQKRLLTATIRVQGKHANRVWSVEFVFFSSPLTSTHPKEQGMRRPVYFQYEMGQADTIPRTVDALLNNWTQIVYLYQLVYDFAEYYNIDQYNLQNTVSVKSFNYSKLLLGYGLNRSVSCNVIWNPQDQQYKLSFAPANQPDSVNAHLLMREEYEVFLNRTKNLAQLMCLLNETYEPLVSVNKLSTLPQMGVQNTRPQMPIVTFTIMAESFTMLRLAYQGMYCLELRLLGDGLVSLRDGAYSRFDRVNVVDEFTPIQGLKTFLSKYADENAISRRRSQSEDDNPPSPITMEVEGSGTTPATSSFIHGSGGGRGGPQSPALQRGSGFHPPPLTPPTCGSNPHTPASPLTNLGQGGSHTNFGSSPATSFNLASPPNINPSPIPHMPHPSPSGGIGMANSPLNTLHVPSPAGLMPPSASPGPSSLSQSSQYNLQGGPHGTTDVASPFTSQSMASPAAAGTNWPGSPSVPRPSPASAAPGRSPLGPHTSIHSPQQPQASHGSRVLPARPWAAAVPTLLTNEALDQLCRPCSHPSNIPGPEMPPIERFLGCVYMRRQLQRYVQAEERVTPMQNNEPGVVQFKTEFFQCRVGLNPINLQSLHIKISPNPDHKDSWSNEELQLLEKFFDTRVAAPPYKPNSLCTFGSMLNVAYNVLKDFIQIIRLELIPGLCQQQGFKWSVQWATRIPPSASPIVPCGNAGILVARNKILLFLQITRLNIQYPPNIEPPTLVLPLVYDLGSNITQLAEKREAGAGAPPALPGQPQGPPGARRMDTTSALTAASHQLKRFSEFNFNANECSLFPAVRDLLMNLTLPTDPPTMQPGSQMVPGGPQIGPGGPQMGPGGPSMGPGGPQMGPGGPQIGPGSTMGPNGPVMPLGGGPMGQQINPGSIPGSTTAPGMLSASPAGSGTGPIGGPGTPGQMQSPAPPGQMQMNSPMTPQQQSGSQQGTPNYPGSGSGSISSVGSGGMGQMMSGGPQ